MNQFVGVHRGVVESVNDPEMRKRYKVRVFTLHPEEVPVDALPWAETAMFAGKMFGDLIAYENGDRVFVMFEGGDRRFPIIVGGSMSSSAGIPDAPSEVRGDYPVTQSRWIRLDRVGNKIEMSPLADERWIKIQSGEASVTLRMNDGTVEIVSNSQVNVTAPQVSVDATEQVTVKTKALIAQVDETATIRSDGTVNVQAGTKINIGRYEDAISGALLPQTTDEVDVRANQNIKVESGGTIDVDATSNINVNTQASYALRAETQAVVDSSAKTIVSSDGDVEITAIGKVKVTATDNIEATSQQKVTVLAATQVEITGQAGIAIKANASNISIDADAGNVTIDAAGSVNVTAIGSGQFQSTGPLTLKSDSQVKIEAPVISIEASATAKLDGGGLTEVKGGLINIG